MLNIFILAAASNAVILAGALAYRSWRNKAQAGLFAAAFLLVASAAVVLITLSHSADFSGSRSLTVAEGLLTLVSGPVLVLFIGGLLGLRISGFWLFAPLLLFGAAWLIWPSILGPDKVTGRLVFVQMAYTAYAAARAITFRPAGRRGENNRRLAFFVLGVLCVLHLAQFVRFGWPEAALVRDIVPVVGAMAFLILTGVVYLGGRVSAFEPLTHAAPVASAEWMALAAALDEALLNRQRLLREPRLTLPQAAAVIGAPPEGVAKAVAAVHGVTFQEHLQNLRVAEARKLLLDPAEARTSVEAVGLLVGFGSRSAFYKAFGERVGMSPAAYRTGHSGNTCPDL